MNAKFYFSHVAFVTLKKYNVLRTEQVLENIRSYAKKNGYKFTALGDGFVLSYELAKRFAKNLHFHCSRLFTFNEAMTLCDRNIVTLSEVEDAQIA